MPPQRTEPASNGAEEPAGFDEAPEMTAGPFVESATLSSEHEHEHETQSPAAPAVVDAELVELARRWTSDLLKAMGWQATIEVRAEGDHVEVTANVTQDESLLTGPKGEVRQAMQHLLNRMINQGEGSRYHLQLEIDDFWKQRESELQEIARSMADRAVAAGDEVVSEYLNAQERRIIHVTLREDARVKTYALGNGMIKRIAVAPAAFEPTPRDDA